MKSIIIFVILFINAVSELIAQPLHNDSIICVIDTTQQFVMFDNHFATDKKNFKSSWQICIKSHYYDSLKPDYKNLACIYLTHNKQVINRIYKSGFNGPYEIKKNKNEVFRRYRFVTDIWINKQSDEKILCEKLGALSFSNFNFVIFKNDIDNEKMDSVVMYRVLLEYGGIEE